MELTLSSNSFQELTKDEMYVVYGGMSLTEAMNVAAIAIAIVGVALTPYALLAAVGPVAIIKAALGGISAMIGLISSVT